MIPLAAFAIAAACLPIDAPKDQITAADLSRALPEWTQVAPETVVGLAPAPGVIRLFHIAELRRLASRFGFPSNPASDLCFQRPLAVVAPDRMLAAMRTHLPDALIEISDSSRMPAPQGELEFPLSGLRTGYWYGSISYGAGHKFVIWARVNVKVTVKRVVASADLKSGQAIDAAQLRIDTIEKVPSPNTPEVGAESMDEFVGRVPRRPIRAGTVVQKEWLDAPRVVQRGDVVKVEVINGMAKLEAEGIADASGAAGEIIPVLNPESKRRFRARIESAGHVSVKGSL